MSEPNDDLLGNQQFEDLDGDGQTDVVIEYFDDNSSIATYDTDGDGVVDAADIDTDGDGKVDLAVVDLGGGTVGVFDDPTNPSASPDVVDLDDLDGEAADLAETFGEELGGSDFDTTSVDDEDDDEDDEDEGSTSWFAAEDDRDDDQDDKKDKDKEVDYDDEDDDDEDDGKHPQGDPDSTGLVGDPFGDAELWFLQAVDGTCAPSTVAQIVSEYTGQEFENEEEFANWAVDNGLMEVYPDGTTSGMYAADIVDMLESHDVPAELEDNLTIQDLKEYLADDIGVAVMVDADEYWGPMYGYSEPEDDMINHIVMVTGIDEDKGVVYINDTGTPDGEALAVPIEDFLDAWDDGDNQAIVCEEPAPDSAAADSGQAGAGLPKSDNVSSLLDGKWALLPMTLHGAEISGASRA